MGHSEIHLLASCACVLRTQSTGVPGGNIRPYNEYYIVAHIAKLMEDKAAAAAAAVARGNIGMRRTSEIGTGKGKASAYWETYFGSDGKETRHFCAIYI